MLQSIDWKLEYDSPEFEEFTADWTKNLLSPSKLMFLDKDGFNRSERSGKK